MTAPEQDQLTEQLLSKASEGDARAIRNLFEQYRNRLSRMIKSRMDPRIQGRVDASDVIQETLIVASQRMDRYFQERPLPFYPWLRQIAWDKLVHLHEHHLRTAKRSAGKEQAYHGVLSDESVLHLSHLLAAHGSSPSQLVQRHERRRQVHAALEQLAEADREVLLLRYLEQLPSKDIAAIMKISEAAVNMRHMRALERMRKILGESLGDI